MKRLLLLLALASFPLEAQQSPPPPTARAHPDDDSRLRLLEEQVRVLTDEVAHLRSQMQSLQPTNAPGTTPGQVLLASSHIEPSSLPASPEAPAPAPASGNVSPAGPPPAQVAQTQTYGGASSNAKLLNPDISLIGDFIGAAGHNDVSPSRSLEMHESEVGMQAIIDPYARADAFLSFGEEGVNVEEAYITFTSLPAGLLLKVGKMRAEFGKVNTIHNHALQYIDRPLATNNLVGGEDGIDDAGISLTRFLPAPKGWFAEGTAQVFRGDSDDLFTANRRQDLSVVGHLRAYRDLNESTNLDLGFSYARGHNNAGLLTSDPSAFLTNLYAADATLRWKPLRRAIYNSFLFRTEFFWSARDQLSALNAFETQHAFGMYAHSEYRLNRRWTIGGRFDRSGRADNAALTDTGFSGILTYWPSEFSQIRGQYRYGHLFDTATSRYDNANEFLFQFLFVMGAHGAHPF